ncbi:hypothetical protein [Mesomycoplasma dispar]|uniref:Lipoprotein n=1 Tax=Mesomycoplasma dispar TaxID=86660 RepID=A0ABN5DTJ7_9BACT|nr:hypothetical protein [Mesomycoplasma dispar]ATP59460.1 hypothetical protein CSW10_00590 [Mesomycoplasma dispar]
MKSGNKNSFLSRKILKITTLTFAPLSVFSTLVAASCTQINSENSLLSKVNYLAIGDAAATGMSEETYRDFQGKMDEAGNLSGQSYPAFFAHFLQKLNKNSLVSYDNLAVNGTSVQNWLYLINPKKYPKGKLSQTFLNSNLTKNDKFNEIGAVFGELENQSFPNFIQKIKKANLLTVSLGFDEIFFTIMKKISIVPSNLPNIPDDLKKLLDQHKKNIEQTDSVKTKKDFKDEIDEKISELKEDFDNLIKELKSINSQLKINLIGLYFSPSSSITKFLKYVLHNDFRLDLDFFDKNIDKTNSAIREIALKNNVNYVDVYDKSLWNEKDSKFSATKLGVYPKLKGQKKIAHQLFLKLALDQNENNKNIDEFKKTSNFNDIVDGKLTYKNVIDIGHFAKSNQELLEKLNEGEKTAEFIDKNSNFEKEQEEKIKDSKLTPTELFKNFISSDFSSDIDISKLFGNDPFFSQLFSNIPDSNSKTFLEKINFIAEILKPLFKNKETNFFDEIFKSFFEFIESITKPGKEDKISLLTFSFEILKKFSTLFVPQTGDKIKEALKHFEQVFNKPKQTDEKKAKLAKK